MTLVRIAGKNEFHGLKTQITARQNQNPNDTLFGRDSVSGSENIKRNAPISVAEAPRCANFRERHVRSIANTMFLTDSFPVMRSENAVVVVTF